MNELSAIRTPVSGSDVETQGISAVGAETKALIVSGVSANTLRSYRFWSREIEVWLGGRSLDDGLLAA